MRILLASGFHYRRGGDSAQFLDLLESLDRRGHQTATFSMHHPENVPSRWSDYWVPHVEYRRRFTVGARFLAAGRSIYFPQSRHSMARLLEDFAPEVVHFHSVQHHLTLAALDACFAADIPVVWTLHDYRTVCPATLLLRRSATCERCAGGGFWHCVAGRCKSGEVSRSLAAATESYITRFRGSLSRVSCFIAPSRFLAAKVLEMGLRAQRIEVVPNPAPLWSPSACARRRHECLYVGRLAPEKGVEHLIEAVAGCDDLQLSIVGEGPSGDDLRALAQRLHANVVFHGWREADDVLALMSSAGVLCVPSLCYENCPGVVLEAMAVGLPVVASNLGGLPELLDHGRAGWMAPPGDPAAWRRIIRMALEWGDETSIRVARAHARVLNRHHPDAFLTAIERVYRSVTV